MFGSRVLMSAAAFALALNIERSHASVTPVGKEYVVGVFKTFFENRGFPASLDITTKKQLVESTLNFTALGSLQLTTRETMFKALLTDDEVLRITADSNIAFVVENFRLAIPTPLRESIDWTARSRHQNTSPSEALTSMETCEQRKTFTDPYFWGQQRISQRERVAYDSGSYTYSYSGEDSGTNVFAYVIDSGIAINHTEFGGRAVWGFTAEELLGEKEWDLLGHGTHVAGILGGDNIGIAKHVTLVAVKVIGQDGSYSFFGVMSGLSFVQEHFTEMRKKSANVRGVINLSLGAYTGINRVIERAIQDVTNAGLIVVASAGNDDLDACGNAPSNAHAAISVGASTVNDTRAWFSNYGACVDILAPGHLINSSTVNGTDFRNIYDVFSGTSLASPFVAGVVARYLSLGNGTRDSVLEFMQSHATKDVIDLSGSNTEPDTPNLLLYAGCNTGFPRNSAQSKFTPHGMALCALLLRTLIRI